MAGGQWAGVLQMLGDAAGAEAALSAGLAANPDHPRLTEGLLLLLRTSGQAARAEAYLGSLLPRLDEQAWIHFQLGDLISARDRRAGNAHLRRAVELEPSADHRTLLVQSLGRTFGDDEGAHLDEAAALARGLAGEALNPRQSRICAEVLTRVCGFEEIDRLGDFATLGRAWAGAGAHTALLWQMPARAHDGRPAGADGAAPHLGPGGGGAGGGVAGGAESSRRRRQDPAGADVVGPAPPSRGLLRGCRYSTTWTASGSSCSPIPGIGV